MICIDRAGRVAGWTAEDALGGAPRDRIGTEWIALVPADDRPAERLRIEAIFAGGPADRRLVRRVRADGATIERWSIPTAVRDGSGQIVAVVEVLGVEPPSPGEARLEQIARTVPDLSNVVVAIAGTARLAASELPAGHPAHDELREIVKATARATELVRRIAALSRPDAPADARAAVVSSVPPRADRSGNGLHVLYVDDERALVNLATRILTRVGYRVTGETRPADALDRFRADPASFDLVVTDLTMPGMSGIELAAALLALRPGIPILVTSGFVRPEERQTALSVGVRDLVLKPNTLERLTELLADLAEGSRGP
jgi:CheY-like chemotaxis protein